MIDIVGFTPSKPEDGINADIRFFDTQTTRAANILSVQVGTLEYAPDFGIDLEYFLTDSVRFQNEGFRSYCVQILANYGINVESMTEAIANLFVTYGFNISPEEQSTSLMAR